MQTRSSAKDSNLKKRASDKDSSVKKRVSVSKSPPNEVSDNPENASLNKDYQSKVSFETFQFMNGRNLFSLLTLSLASH